MSRQNSVLFPSAILSRHSDEHRHVWRAGRDQQCSWLREVSQPFSHNAVIPVYDAAGNPVGIASKAQVGAPIRRSALEKLWAAA
jgi:hypothetical protein